MHGHTDIDFAISYFIDNIRLIVITILYSYELCKIISFRPYFQTDI